VPAPAGVSRFTSIVVSIQVSLLRRCVRDLARAGHLPWPE
jgi:hypothetical protein